MIVSSLTQELDVRFSALIKSRALGGPLLPLLTFEADFGDLSKLKPAKIDKALVSDMAAARKAANDKVKELGADDISGDLLREAMASKQQLMLSIDSSWVVEAAFVTYLTGEGGEADLRGKIMLTFPDEGNMGNKTFATTLKALQELSTSRSFDFYSRAAKADRMGGGIDKSTMRDRKHNFCWAGLRRMGRRGWLRGRGV